MSEMYERNVVVLYKSGAFKVDLENPFTLRSGFKSPFYLQCADIQNDPALYRGALEDMNALVRGVVDPETFDRVSGGETRDWIFSIPLALTYLNKPHVMIRKKATDHGVGGRLITTINEGERLIHVADLRTSGTSEVQDWIPTIREAGGIIDHSFSYVDRLQGGLEALGELDPPVQGHSVVPLGSFEEFFRIGLEAGQMERREYESLCEYAKDPEGWRNRWTESHR
ncbi:MAG: hypothetical protein ABIJ92_03295 [Candidatus Aenigmatarchaeota archaeon]